MRKVCGWVGQILRVNLYSAKISTIPTEDYVPGYLGGRGIAAKIAWDELSPQVGCFDAENPLMIMTGPFTGTVVPGSGRCEFFGVSPQVYPKPWFTRSGMGGWFGSELKYAGFDGIIINGTAEKPVYLWIDDGKTQILSAEELWGRDTYATQHALMKRHGADVKVVSIGPAGENLVRWSVILSETTNAAGQGGLGAVMGSKKLKAIVVKGSGPIRIAQPKELLDFCQAINRDCVAQFPVAKPPAEAKPQLMPAYGLKEVACSHACSFCPWRWGWMWQGVPGKAYPAINTSLIKCLGNAFPGSKESAGTPKGWYLGEEAGLEVSALTNKFGLNQWDLVLGLLPWLTECKSRHLIDKIDGLEIDLNNPEFWVSLLKKISYREGIGNILAEGAPRAADIMGIGQDIVRELYPAYGFAGHWDGHGDKFNQPFFPFWIVSAIQWATDTRDPFSSAHGYMQNIILLSKALSWKEIISIGEFVYGSPKASDPHSGYEFKAEPAIWHQHESILKDSLALCDQSWPKLYSFNSDDRYARVTIPQYGTIEGKAFEAYLYHKVTGTEINENELRKRAEAIFNLERALQVRNYGRSRKDDLAIIPYFETPENIIGPSGKRESLDREKFITLMDKYYQMRGWNPKNGWPTEAKLKELGLADVARELGNLTKID
ncbi:hypothetical protein FJZ31_21525 [Candidatus Poribacteria bacterium]|nr:hypothetical protein [Candidatus Poribacteria bacterium]